MTAPDRSRTPAPANDAAPVDPSLNNVGSGPDERVVIHVRHRAHEIFLARNGGPGDDLSDWLQAERELKAAPAAGSRTPTPART